MRTIDINTSDQTIDGALPGETFRPLRYTESERDAIRVGVWTQLRTVFDTYAFDRGQGLDVETILDPATSDAERSALVADVVLAYPGVLSITDGPTVTVVDGSLASISLRALTADGPIALVA